MLVLFVEYQIQFKGEVLSYMKKKTIIGFITTILLVGSYVCSSSVVVFASGTERENILIVPKKEESLYRINGTSVDESDIIQNNGVIYFPLDTILDRLKIHGIWDEKKQKNTFVFENKTIELTIQDSNWVVKSDSNVWNEVLNPPILKNDQVYVDMMSFVKVLDLKSDDQSGDFTTEIEVEFAEEYYFIPEPLPSKLIEIYEMKGHIDKSKVTYDDLQYIRPLYIDFNGEIQVGELVVAKEIAQEMCEIFRELYDVKYPIEKMEAIYKYDFLDRASMEDNNTSGFNYRLVDGTDRLSKHAYGLAVDINPMQNPFIQGNYISPKGSELYRDRESYQKGMILEGDVVYNAFMKRGYTWGGHWNTMKDYQHFQK